MGVHHQVSISNAALMRPLYWNWYRTRNGTFIRLLTDYLNLEIEEI